MLPSYLVHIVRICTTVIPYIEVNNVSKGHGAGLTDVTFHDGGEESKGVTTPSRMMSASLCMYAFEARSSCQFSSMQYMRAMMAAPSSVSFAEANLGKEMAFAVACL